MEAVTENDRRNRPASAGSACKGENVGQEPTPDGSDAGPGTVPGPARPNIPAAEGGPPDAGG